jgi:hypothetical protein
LEAFSISALALAAASAARLDATSISARRRLVSLLGADARLGLGLRARLGFGALLRFGVGARRRFLVGLHARFRLDLGDARALLGEALLELRLRGELRLGEDLRLHRLAGLLLDVVLQQLFHLAADPRLDLVLERAPSSPPAPAAASAACFFAAASASARAFAIAAASASRAARASASAFASRSAFTRSSARRRLSASCFACCFRGELRLLLGDRLLAQRLLALLRLDFARARSDASLARCACSIAWRSASWRALASASSLARAWASARHARSRRRAPPPWPCGRPPASRAGARARRCRWRRRDHALRRADLAGAVKSKSSPPPPPAAGRAPAPAGAECRR